MRVKNIVDEDFVNYKRPSMFISTSICDWKCCKEQHLDVSICQNADIVKQPTIDISADEIFRRYISNPISEVVVFGGLESFLQFDEMYEVIKTFRDNGCNDIIIIYTGYEIKEISEQCNKLKADFNNIILKTGRYIPNHQPHYDEILGINLISDNQKGVVLC